LLPSLLFISRSLDGNSIVHKEETTHPDLSLGDCCI
jgi:hypothetical protein